MRFSRSKQFSLPAIEAQVLKFWDEHRIFEKSLESRRKRGKPFRFFEGPPTANGLPGVHHALARAFKDIILRYKTMRGYYVLRRAGWDTHGLPVEIAVEKELGIKHKSEIEKLGIAEFNQRAKLSVWRYKHEWERFTKRIGFWLDFRNPYITYENSYIETLWWMFRQIEERGLLKKLHKVIPWCVRCETPLSNNELAQPGAYQKAKDPSVYVKLLLKETAARKRGREYLLVWTTTPWTLPANAAVAVNPAVTYTKFKIGDDFIWSCNPPPKTASAPEVVAVEKIAGAKLVGRPYQPLYPARGLSRAANERIYRVCAADFVSTDEGTGFVHISPAFGADDFNLIERENRSKSPSARIPIFITVNGSGIVQRGFPGGGKFFKQADRDIIADLKKRGFLYDEGVIEHDYPFCWRCQTPLIYLARLTWFIEMSKLTKDLLAANENTNWIPGHIREGRFGEWIKEGKDWSISRERYWGTPLPIWEGEKCDYRLVAGSFEDLNRYRPKKENRYFLVRHGEAESTVENRVDSQLKKARKNPLTERGEKRAEKIAQQLAREHINFVIASPFLRTRETAYAIAKAAGLKVTFDKRLAEINTGVFDGRNIKEYQSYFSNFFERFTKQPPGGETLSDVRKRMVEFFRELDQRYTGKTIVVVSHAGPLLVLEAAVRGIHDDRIETVKSMSVGECREFKFPYWPFNRGGELDFHRPFVDEIVLRCPECGGRMRRVKEVGDVWFDSGAMPFAQWHYPFEHKEMVDRRFQFPADYIVEGMDQTRGWFYTLLAISTLLWRGASYRNVISTGLVLDKNGQKMSKSKGNVVDPMATMEKHGADALRWYLYTVNDPGDPKRFDEAELEKVVRRVFLIIWNTYVFLETYRKEKQEPIVILDTWIKIRLQEVTRSVTVSLDRFQIGEAARVIETFVIDDLSRWYIRRSRKNVSPKVLAEVLVCLAKLMAPFAPFFAEALYKSLTTDNKQLITSVHLTNWPEADAKKIDKKLLAAMAEVRRFASLALAEREKAGIKVRQPLAKLKVKSDKLKGKRELLQLLKDEVNVKEITFDSKLKIELELDTKITPELYEEGMAREITRMVQKLRQDAGCHFKDMIALRIAAPKELLGGFKNHERELKSVLKAKSLEVMEIGTEAPGTFDAVIESKLEEKPIRIQLRKL